MDKIEKSNKIEFNKIGKIGQNWKGAKIEKLTKLKTRQN